MHRQQRRGVRPGGVGGGVRTHRVGVGVRFDVGEHRGGAGRVHGVGGRVRWSAPGRSPRRRGRCRARRRATCSAAVPEPTATQCRLPATWAHASSSRPTSGSPGEAALSRPLRRTRSTACSSASVTIGQVPPAQSLGTARGPPSNASSAPVRVGGGGARCGDGLRHGRAPPCGRTSRHGKVSAGLLSSQTLDHDEHIDSSPHRAVSPSLRHVVSTASIIPGRRHPQLDLRRPVAPASSTILKCHVKQHFSVSVAPVLRVPSCRRLQ